MFCCCCCCCCCCFHGFLFFLVFVLGLPAGPWNTSFCYVFLILFCTFWTPAGDFRTPSFFKQVKGPSPKITRPVPKSMRKLRKKLNYKFLLGPIGRPRKIHQKIEIHEIHENNEKTMGFLSFLNIFRNRDFHPQGAGRPQKNTNLL